MTSALPPGVVCRIQLLGPPGIWTTAGHLSASKPFVFGAALFIGMQRGQAVSRNALATMLWPDVEGPTRGERLRWLVAQLRIAGLPAPARAPELTLASDQVITDVAALEAATSVPEVLVLVRGDVLAGYEPAISDSYTRWLDTARETLRSQVLRLLIVHLSAARREGRWADVEELARRVTGLDELHEGASIAMVEALTMQGRTDRAAEVLARLRAETGSVSPMPAVRRIQARVREIAEGHDASRPRMPLVGREAVFARLLDSIDPARRTSACIALAGPSGIGKSRTLLEFATAAALRGTRVVRTVCARSDALRPISLVVDLTRQLLELRGALGASPESIEVLHRLLGDSARAAEHAAPELRRAAVYAALRDLLAALVEDGPIAVIADDVQWAEHGSWTILAPLVGGHARVTWTLGLRSESEIAAGELFRRMIGSVDLAREDADFHWLSTLPPSDVAALCAQRVAPRRIPPATMELLVARAAGIPFLAEALVQHWSETGELDSLPPSVSRLVLARLERLSRDALRSLEAIAILGPNADAAGVEAVSTLGRGALLEAVRELDAVGILRTTDGILSAHALWMEAVLARVAPAPLHVLHRSAAEWLEHLTGLSTVPDHRRQWAIASHWLDAADPGRARQALEHAAQTLIVNGFVRDASRMLERAAALAGVSESALHYLERAAELLLLDHSSDPTADLQRIEIPFERVARLLQGGRYSPHHEIEHCLVVVRSRVDTSVIPEDGFLRCVLAKGASTSHRLEAARSLMWHYSLGETGRETMLAVWDEVAILPRTGEVQEMLFESYAAAHFVQVAGDPVRGLAHALRAKALIDSNPGTYQLEIHRVHHVLAYAYEWNGDLDRAQQVRRESIEHGRRLNIPSIVNGGLIGLVGTALEAGRIAEGRNLLPEFGEPRAEDSSPSGRARMIAWVVCALEEGNVEEARRWLTVSLDEATSVPGKMPRARFHAIYAHLALIEDDADAMRRILPGLLDCFGERENYMDHPALVAGLCLERLEGTAAASGFVTRFLADRPERWTPREDLLRLAAGAPRVPTVAR